MGQPTVLTHYVATTSVDTPKGDHQYRQTRHVATTIVDKLRGNLKHGHILGQPTVWTHHRATYSGVDTSKGNHQCACKHHAATASVETSQVDHTS